MSEGYQGYSNWDTWSLIMTLGNDEKLYAEVYDLIVFNACQQHKASAISYAVALQRAASRFCGPVTADGVKLTQATSIVNWDEVAEYFGEEIKKLDRAWSDRLDQLGQNPNGGFSNVIQASEQFRKEHRYKRWWIK